MKKLQKELFNEYQVNNMQRDSFIFYRSFYEAIKELPRDIQGEVLTTIMEYGLEGVTTDNLKPVARAIFTLIKPILDEQDKGHSIIKTFHWNWKGGISKENALIRGSSIMRSWRIKVYTRDDYKCQDCGAKDIELNAHHIMSFAEYPELRFDINNGITLCKPCHIKEHKRLRNAKR